MKINNIEVFNLTGAIRGMRNPMNSHQLSDSICENGDLVIGKKDMELAKKLIQAGKDHRKFLRQIFVSMDISAPEYWWKQYHTYKVSTTENSTSQMHTLGKRPLCRPDFEIDDDFTEFDYIILEINKLISEWNKDKNPYVWRKLIQIMPQSFLYTKTCTMTYETLFSICISRKNHKLKEWNFFIDIILSSCPYLKEFLS